jgi:hypothetical protein
MFAYYTNPEIIQTENKQETKIETETENETLKDQMERKIKNKYNMLIPAIYMEIKLGKESVEVNKDDVKKVINPKY